MNKLKFSSMLVATLAVLVAAGAPAAAKSPKKKGKLLYMTLSAGFHHEVVPFSTEIVKQIGDKSGAFETPGTDYPERGVAAG